MLISETRFGGDGGAMPAGRLSSDPLARHRAAPIPGLPAALSRRRAIFGVVEAEPPSAALPEPPEAAEARALHARRQLEAALDHGTALLAALGLPRLVDAGFVPIDPETADDALADAVALLDAIDAPGEDLEPWLTGSYNPSRPLDAERDFDEEEDDFGEDDGTSEPSLGALEDQTDQTVWARGGDDDREVDDADLEDGDEDGDVHDQSMALARPPAFLWGAVYVE